MAPNDFYFFAWEPSRFSLLQAACEMLSDFHGDTTQQQYRPLFLGEPAEHPSLSQSSVIEADDWNCRRPVDCCTLRLRNLDVDGIDVIVWT